MKLPKSENVLIVLATLSSMANVVFKEHSHVVSVVGVVSALIGAAVFALYQTPLSAEVSGWKTKAFWGSLITVAGSVCLALSEMQLPGVGQKISQIAGFAATAIVSCGYAVHRYQVKVKV